MTWPIPEVSHPLGTGLLGTLLAPALFLGPRYLWHLAAVKHGEDRYGRLSAEVNRLYREEEYWERLHRELASLDEPGRLAWLERLRQNA